MSKARSLNVYALLILPVLASMPASALAENYSAALAQNNSAALAQNNPAALAQNDPVALAQDGSSVPRFQLTSPVAFLSEPDTGPIMDSNSAPVLDSGYQQTPQAAPPPPEVRHVTRKIERETRRWHGGGRIGFGFSPELFMFGLQSQIGPIFNPRLLFRPNIEFGFGELTDMFAVNLEGAYWLRTRIRGQWRPYFGMGPSLNFIHQGASSGDVSFSNFTYETGFNVFLGAQKDKMFVEMKTALWSGPSPVLRLFLGYNF